MTSQKSRLHKVEFMKKNIIEFFQEKPDGAISRKKLVALFALNNNSTVRTGNEIIQILADTNFIKLENDNILCSRGVLSAIAEYGSEIRKEQRSSATTTVPKDTMLKKGKGGKQ